MNRRGVVLLITVGFITAIMAIIAYQFAIVDRGLKRASEETFYYQSALLLHDVQKKLLPTVLKEVLNQCGDLSKEECLEGFLSMSYNLPTPLLNDPTIGTAVITLSPPAKGFDPNGFKTLAPDDRVFFGVFTQELIDPLLLMELVDLALDTNSSVNSSYEYLKTDNDIPINNIFFRKGDIVDREQFDVILDAYYARTLDKKVYSLPWDEFLDFRTQNEPPVFALIKPEYCRSLFPDQPIEWQRTYCENEDEILYTEADVTGIPYAELNATLATHNITFEPNTKTVLVDVDFTQDEHTAHFRFLYDLSANTVRWTEVTL
jgi:hypothetical protein